MCGGFIGKVLGLNRRPDAPPPPIPPAVQAPQGSVQTRQQSAEVNTDTSAKKKRMGKQSLFVSKSNSTNTSGGNGLNA